MNLGLAIFLSAVFLGTVALYIATMDRWNWKKIVIRPLLGVLLLLGLCGVGLLLWVYWPQAEKTAESIVPRFSIEEIIKDEDFLASGRETQREILIANDANFAASRRQIQDVVLARIGGQLLSLTVTDVPLGSSKADVRFLKGEPSSELPDRWRYTAGFPKLPKGFELENSRDLTGPHLLIYFNDEKVHAVLCGHRPRDIVDVLLQTSPCGYAIGMTSGQITTSYGEPTEVKRLKDELTRVYLFPERKEMLVLETNRVVFAGTYDPDVEAPSEFF